MNLVTRIFLALLVWTMLSVVLISGWGWDQARSFFDQLPRALLLPVWLAFSIYGTCRNTRTSFSGGKKEIRCHRKVFWFLLPLIVIWFVYLPFADRHEIGTSSSPMLRWLGLVVFAASMSLRIEAIRAQGQQFSMAVAIQKAHKLATTGPYRLIRHPAYLGVIGMVLGISLIFSNLTVGLMATAFSWFWLGTRIRDEEKLLLEEFGENFIRYQERTRKIIPFIH